MKLFTNGCSFTWGGAIYPSLYDQQGNLLDYNNTSEINQKRLNDVWPAQLRNLLGADQVVNLAIGCGSNERIVRTTMDYFTSLIHNQNFSKDWYAIIQWSIPSRFEYWDDNSESWAMCMVNGSMTSKEVEWRHVEQIDNFAKHIWVNFNDITYSQRYWTQVIALSSFFNNLGIPYWFSNLDTSVLFHLQPHQYEYLQNHINWIDNSMTKNFDNLFEEKHDSGSGHPSVFGHQQIATNMYNFLQDKIV